MGPHWPFFRWLAILSLMAGSSGKQGKRSGRLKSERERKRLEIYGSPMPMLSDGFKYIYLAGLTQTFQKF